MAHLWLRSDEDLWTAHRLGHQHGLASANGACLTAATDPHDADIRFLRIATPAGDSWVVIAAESQRIRVNGTRVVGGIRALRDRDEISCAAFGAFYFSTESLAAVESFSGSPDSLACCPRCKQVIATGTDSVRCPTCAIVHHASGELPCWTYAETCALCDQPTDSTAGFRWVPEGA